MNDQDNAGWNIGVNDHDNSGNIIRTTYYYVAFPDETAAIAAMYDQHKLLNGADIGYLEPIGAEVLKQYNVKAGTIYEYKVLQPRGS